MNTRNYTRNYFLQKFQKERLDEPLDELALASVLGLAGLTGSLADVAAATLLVWRTKLHLLWMLGAGALLGVLGWV